MKQKRLSAKKRREIIESVFGKVPLEKFKPGIYNDCDRWLCKLFLELNRWSKNVNKF